MNGLGSLRICDYALGARIQDFAIDHVYALTDHRYQGLGKSHDHHCVYIHRSDV